MRARYGSLVELADEAVKVDVKTRSSSGRVILRSSSLFGPLLCGLDLVVWYIFFLTFFWGAHRTPSRLVLSLDVLQWSTIDPWSMDMSFEILTPA